MPHATQSSSSSAVASCAADAANATTQPTQLPQLRSTSKGASWDLRGPESYAECVQFAYLRAPPFPSVRVRIPHSPTEITPSCQCVPHPHGACPVLTQHRPTHSSFSRLQPPGPADPCDQPPSVELIPRALGGSDLASERAICRVRPHPTPPCSTRAYTRCHCRCRDLSIR